MSSIRKGQVWECCDRRQWGSDGTARQILVERVEEGNVYGRVHRSPIASQVGRSVVVDASKFRPGPAGYKLIRE